MSIEVISDRGWYAMNAYSMNAYSLHGSLHWFFRARVNRPRVYSHFHNRFVSWILTLL